VKVQRTIITVTMFFSVTVAGCASIQENTRTVEDSSRVIRENTTAVTRSSDTMSNLQTSLEGVAELRPSLQGVADLDPRLRDVAALETELKQFAELEPTLARVAALRLSMRQLVESQENTERTLAEVSQQMAGLKGSLKEASHLKAPLRQLADVADAVRQGAGSPLPYFIVGLVWLLTTFFGCWLGVSLGTRGLRRT
jgi:chromosome segregation ATPase